MTVGRPVRASRRRVGDERTVDVGQVADPGAADDVVAERHGLVAVEGDAPADPGDASVPQQAARTRRMDLPGRHTRGNSARWTLTGCSSLPLVTSVMVNVAGRR
jgi:hypothetical protein